MESLFTILNYEDGIGRRRKQNSPTFFAVERNLKSIFMYFCTPKMEFGPLFFGEAASFPEILLQSTPTTRRKVKTLIFARGLSAPNLLGRKAAWEAHGQFMSLRSSICCMLASTINVLFFLEKI